MLGLIISSAVCGVLLISVLIASYYAYKSAFWSRGSAKQVREYFKKDKFSPLEEKISVLSCQVEGDKYEDVFVNAYDGVKLYARYYEFKKGAPVHVLMHGYKGNPVRSMCGNYKIAKDLGHNILMVDMRGCRQSGGRAVTFGIKERYDALSWVEFLSKHSPASPVFLVGLSLGGATVTMANTEKLPLTVVGVIADCPFSSPKEILKKVCRDKGMPKIVFPFIILGAILFAHFNPYSFDSVKASKMAKAPLLLIHGEQDGFVPVKMGKEIFDACVTEKTFLQVPGADHALCYMTDSEAYENAVREFVCRQLNHKIIDTVSIK